MSSYSYNKWRKNLLCFRIKFWEDFQELEMDDFVRNPWQVMPSLQGFFSPCSQLCFPLDCFSWFQDTWDIDRIQRFRRKQMYRSFRWNTCYSLAYILENIGGTVKRFVVRRQRVLRLLKACHYSMTASPHARNVSFVGCINILEVVKWIKHDAPRLAKRVILV